MLRSYLSFGYIKLDSDRVNRWLSLGANLGVLIGIIFLAIELRQNNANLATEVRATAFFARAETWSMVAENPELSEAIVKDFDQSELTPPEANQMFSYWVRVFLFLQWDYHELPEDEFRRGLAFQRTAFLGSSTLPSAWERARPLLDPAFVEFMDENVYTAD